MPAFSAFNAIAGGDAEAAAAASGTDWTERANPKNFRLNAIYHDGTTWCAIGASDGSDSYMVTSTDGITWTEQASEGAVFMNGIVFAESLWVAVGNTDGGDGHIITASDPTSTWTERTSPEDLRFSDITHGNGVFVAVGNADSEPYGAWSLNGTTDWTRGTMTSLPADLLIDVAYGAGVFCAIGNTICLSSADDGETWTDRTSSLPNSTSQSNSIIFDGTQFVALGGHGEVWTSSDGTTSWSELTTSGDYTTTNDQGTSIAYDGVGTYVIVGADPTDGAIWTSTDLLAWTAQTVDADLNNMGDVYYADGQFIAVGLEGSDGPDAGIMTAPGPA